VATNPNKKEDRIPAGAINPQKIYTPEAIARDAKVPLTPAQQTYVGSVASERLQAQANAALAAQKAAEAAAKAEAERLAAEARARAEAEARNAALLAEQNRIASLGAGTSASIALLQTQIANLMKSMSTPAPASTTTTQATSVAAPQRESIMTILNERFTRYGLSSLVPKIKELAIDGATEATITFALQETDEYKTRFKANQDRAKKGLTVLSPAEYLNLEDTYRQVLRSYGLKQFDTDEYVSQFISNDIAPAELSSRVVTAVQRVQNADPAVSRTLRDYYGIGNADMVAYVLDPENQLQKIERQVAAAEIGTAARIQGLETGVAVAEQLAAQGVTQAVAQKGYATIADILPTAEKLSKIYGETTGVYGQSQAEQEIFNSLASAQRARQRLTEREIATFGAKSGLMKSSLSTQSGGQI
jgi:hypothetical protein